MSEPADAVRIRQFARELPGGMAELVQHFVAQMTATLADLDAAARESNAERTRVLSHRGVGTAGVCGADPLVQVLRRIESAAKDGRVDTAGVAAAGEEFVRLRAFLDGLVGEESGRR
jgi:hypothetical protein